MASTQPLFTVGQLVKLTFHTGGAPDQYPIAYAYVLEHGDFGRQLQLVSALREDGDLHDELTYYWGQDSRWYEANDSQLGVVIEGATANEVESHLRNKPRSQLVDVRPLPRGVLEGNPNPVLCRFCNAKMRMRYPGGDPENGPARMSCEKPWCDTARDYAEQAHHLSMTDGTTLDDLHAEAIDAMAEDLHYRADQYSRDVQKLHEAWLQYSRDVQKLQERGWSYSDAAHVLDLESGATNLPEDKARELARAIRTKYAQL